MTTPRLRGYWWVCGSCWQECRQHPSLREVLRGALRHKSRRPSHDVCIGNERSSWTARLERDPSSHKPIFRNSELVR